MNRLARIAISLLVMLFVQWLANAQTTSTASLTAPAAANPNSADAQPKPAKYVLKSGTELKLKLAHDLSSKTSATGDPVELVLDEDVKVGDVIVVPKGTMARGTVSHAKKAGNFGRGGELNLRLEHLRAGDTKVPLRGVRGEEGKGKEGTVVALTVAFGPVGFLKHGKQAQVKAGTAVAAFVDQDTEVAVNK